MGKFDINISGGTPPYSHSVKLAGGDSVERFVSIAGNTITFNHEISSNPKYYVLRTVDGSGCEYFRNFELTCSCDNSLDTTPIDVQCAPDGLSAFITFNVIDNTGLPGPVQITSGAFNGEYTDGQQVNWIMNITPGSVYNLIMSKDTCTRTVGIPINCQPECTFTFTFHSIICDRVLINPPSSTYQVVGIYEVSNPSINLFTARNGNELWFNPIYDGVEHSYTVVLEQTTGGSPTGCTYSRNFNITCGTTEPDCGELDIVFCMDDSFSVDTEGGTEFMKTGLKSIVDSLTWNINSGNVKIGTVKFGTFPTKLLDLSSNISSIKNSIDQLSFEGLTGMCQGLNLSNTTVRGIGARNCDKLILLVTDGQPNRACDGSSETVTVAKTQTRNFATNIKSQPFVGTDNQLYSLKIMCIGITDSSDEVYLKSLASNPDDVLVANSFEDFPQMTQLIVETLCQEYGIDPAEPNID